MPRRPTCTEIHLETTVASLTPMVTLLKELNDTFGPPFVQPIVCTIESLIDVGQNVKRNRNTCAQLMENIHQVLYAIIQLHIRSETAGSLPPAMLDHTGNFLKTLHKIYRFFEAQQDGSKLKQLFRSNETSNLLKDCQAGLEQALEVFRINIGAAMSNDIVGMIEGVKMMHEGLLELIPTLSDASTISDRSSVYLHASELENSSNSFSLLPAKPKIFHGRESELDKIIKLLSQQPARIAILGGGGMGKTSLARAVLHHPSTSAKFEHRFFVSAESATTSVELAALIGLHIGLNPGKDLTRPVVRYFSSKPSCLLVLDNLETVWEPIKSRAKIEEFLSLLTEAKHLALIITLRGAERPANVRWTHPFLLPLKPLSKEAAMRTFMDITDNSVLTKEMNQLLHLTDNMPLAVNIIAHLVDYEGCNTVLNRWEAEKTSLLSAGHDKKSNLDASITLSLSSPRMTVGGKKLLSLLSVLPDGVSDVELVQSNLPITDILGCKATLLATALAYQDEKKRLRSLVPIREHVQQFLPPAQSLLHSLRKHFYALLELYQKYKTEQLQPLVHQITANLGNLQEVLGRGLVDSDPNLAQTIYCTISLNHFYGATSRGNVTLMDYIQPILPQPCDHRLEATFLIDILWAYRHHPSFLPEQLMDQAKNHFQYINDPILESKFYQAAGAHFFYYEVDLARALQFYEKALELSKLARDSDIQAQVLKGMALLKIRSGNYCAAQVYNTEAIRLAKISGNLVLEADAHSNGAMCSRFLGNYPQSVAQNHRAKELIGICGLSGGVIDQNITVDQAEIHLLKTEYSQARSIHSQMAEANAMNENACHYALSLLNIAQIDITIGKTTEEVYQNLDTARQIFNSLDSQKTFIVLCDIIQADMQLRERKFDLAKAKFQECMHSAWGIDNEVESFCLERLANVRAWQTPEESIWPVIYLGYALKFREKLVLHNALLFIGDLFIAHYDERTAMSLYTVALEGFTHMDVHRNQAQCMLRLGDLANKQGNISLAILHWTGARPLFERSSQAADVAQVDSRLTTVENAHQDGLVKLENQYVPVQLVKEGNL
ncbi:hypothetical protein K438DRAFT_1936075 [Mycena galopus ATCC 62051]|nr:hypothetical protein K438DRAFT_1936075 [Mycena galopus ATCC 62051]